jgi:hypothetical protein
MTHDVTFVESFYDPNTRFTSQRPRFEHNLDRTNTWGLHLAYQQPVADSGWRVGGTLTTNLMSHPKLPDYQVQQILRIPWDPGHSAAYNFGVGVSHSVGPTTFGIDAIYEPIWTHTWGEAEAPTETPSGAIIPAGAKTTENHFRFSNGILRVGVAQDIKLQDVESPVRLQLGLQLHSISYRLGQLNHVQEAFSTQDEHWLEWLRTWGLGFRFSGVDLRYTGRLTSGTGRPGILRTSNAVPASSVLAASNVIAAPNGPLTLTDVRVLTHQLSISVPLP